MSQGETHSDRARIGIVVALWVVALAVAVMAGAPWKLHTRLTVGGGALEVIGITLLALDLIAEPGRRARMRAVAVARQIVGALRRLLRRGQSVVISAGTATAHFHGSDAGVVIGKSKIGSVEDQLAQLREELDDLRNQVADVEGRLGREVSELRADLNRTRDELELSIEDSIAASKREYVEWRLGGFAIALAGSVLLSVANLV